ncbi:MAG: nucleoside kinase [Anaerolineae bacterium]
MSRVSTFAHIRPAEPRRTVQARFPDGRIFEGPVGTPVEAFIHAATPAEDVPIMAAIVNGKLRELSHPLYWDSSVQPLSMQTSDGLRIFQRSLTFVLVVAAHELFPEATIIVDHSIPTGGFFCEVAGRPLFSAEELAHLEQRMHEIVQADEPIRKHVIPISEAIAVFQQQGYTDKVRLLQGYAGERPNISIYSLRGVYDYFYGYMAPSTGELQPFALRPAEGGFLLLFPTRHRPRELTEPAGTSRLSAVFREHLDWMRVMNIDDAASLNDAARSGRLREVILVAEALHEKRIAEIAEQIVARRPRLVLIAGPSSSGKTTFIKRLAIQLLAAGVRPVSLGLDDYFLDRELTPRDEKGEYDFEALEAIDLALFNRHLLELFAGEEVLTPRYNFQTGHREQGRRLRITPDHIVLVEGIHGLNPQLVPHIPPEQVFRIYVSALTQLNLDCHNRIPTTDTRLIRRIVRDAQFRGYNAQQTIAGWEKVRRGERLHIYPYQEHADVMFNSALLYELAVLRPFVEPLLRQITPSHTMEYIEASRLLAFLSWFEEAGPDLVPETSILREFIGGSALADVTY